MPLPTLWALCAMAAGVAVANHSPTLRAASLDTQEDTPASVPLEAADEDHDALTFTVTKKPAHGQLVVDAAGQATFTPAKDFHGDDSATVAVSDGKASVSAPLVLRVAPVNDPPQARPLALSTKEDTRLTATLSATDVDGDRLTFQLAVEPAHGAATVDAKTGALAYLPAADFNGADALTVEVSDGTAAVPLQIAITVTAVNDAPVATAATVSGDEDTRLSGVLAGADIDHDALTFRVLKKPAHAELTVDAKTGAFTLVPARDVNGADSFSFEVSDGTLHAEATVRVELRAVNDPPTASPLALSTREDTEVHGTLAARDVDLQPLTFVVKGPAAHGTATIDAKTGAVAYLGAANFNGVDRFTVEVSDGEASIETEVTVTVGPVNDAPTLSAATLGLDEDTKLETALTAQDVDGDTLTWRLAAPPSHGAAAVDPKTGQLTYTPAKNFNGDDTCTVEVSDGTAKASAQVTLKVAPVNDAPVAQPLTLNTKEDALITGAVVASDVDSVLTYRVSGPPAHGSAMIDAKTGSVSYQGALDFNGTDHFTVEVSDGSLVALSEVSVTVASVNDAPTTTAAAFSLDEDGRLETRLSAQDVDHDALTFRIATNAKHGEASVDATGAFRYAPVKNFFGDDSCTIEVSDGQLKASAEVTVHVNPVNDAPLAQPLALTTAEEVLVKGQVVATDVDSALAFSLVKAPQHGRATVDAKSGAVTYQGELDFNGADTFTVQASDGSLTALADVSVTVTPVNDAPVFTAVPLTVDEDTTLTVTLVASDVDHDALRWSLTQRPTHGVATVDAATGKLSYTPAHDFFGDDTCTVEVSDGQLKASAPLVIKVRAVNDAPVARPLHLSTQEDTAAKGTIQASDVDSPLTFRVSSPPSHGTATVDAAGAVSYLPAPNFNGNDAVTVEVSDGELTARAEVTVAVAAVNDAPVVPAVTFTVAEDGRLEATVASSDVDGDALTTRLSTAPAHGAATVDPTGKLVFIPNKDFNGADNLIVEVSDGKVKTLGAVTLVVSAVNDAPVSSPVALSTSEDVAIKGLVPASDIDRDPLTWSIKSQPTHGVAEVEAKTGLVTYTPSPNTNGADAFVVEVSDGALTSLSKVTLAVAAVDDPPVVHEATLQVLEDTPGEGSLPATEADAEKLTFRLVSTPRLGTAQLLDAAAGTWRFIPGPDLNGDDQVAFEVSDGKTTVAGVMKVHVAPVNDAPVVASLSLATSEERPAEGTLVGTDVDRDSLSYSVASQPVSNGQPSGKATMRDPAKGVVRFDPPKDFNGTATFTVVASDGQLSSAPATVTVVVDPVNDAPVASDERRTIDEDEVAKGTLAATDVDGDALTFRAAAPSHGAVAVDSSTGRYTYTPTANYSGDDAFTFTVTDSAGASSTAFVRFTINEVNDPPVAISDSISVPRRGIVTGQLKGYDRESKTVTFQVVDKPSNGEFKLIDAQTGAFTFSTDGQYTRNSVLRFVVSDGAKTSAPGELSILIQSM